MTAHGKGISLGGLVGWNDGTIDHSYTAITVKGGGADGGVSGINDGLVNASYATGAVSSTGWLGGLVGSGGGTISGSYATGSVKGRGYLGGLVGIFDGTIDNSYATGAVTGGTNSDVGGLVGENGFQNEPDFIGDSYSTGPVTGGAGSDIGGLIGYDVSQPGSVADSYWDIDTSGITNLGQGAGNIANDPGITGLTTAQFQAALPQGFDPKVWAEKTNVDDGFPYLIANKPVK